MDDVALAAVVFPDALSHSLRIGHESIHPFACFPVPDPERGKDRGEDPFDRGGDGELADIAMCIGPEITGGRVTIGNMKSIRSGDDAFTERAAVRDDDVKSREVIAFGRGRHEGEIPLVFCLYERGVLEKRRP